MKIKPKEIYFLFAMAFCCLFACERRPVLDEFKPVPGQAWNYSYTPLLKANIQQLGVPYTLKLNVRVSPSYQYHDLSVLVHQVNPQGSSTVKKIGVKIRDSEGEWTGKGAGSFYTYQIIYQRHVVFPDTGTYLFKLEHHMRDNPLVGVSDVGICVEPEVGVK